MLCALNQCARWLGIRENFPDCEITSWSTDSRSIEPGGCYFAWPGEHFDGHDFLEEAVARGASAVVVNRPVSLPVPSLVVDDTYAAFLTVMRSWRQQFDCPVIGITGSAGKTTVTQCVKQLAEAHFGADAVLATTANHNNILGVGQTIARLRAHHRVAIVEVGIDRPGEMQQAVRCLQPDIALINNILPTHLDRLENEQAIAQEKGFIFSELREKGVAIFGMNSPYRSQWQSWLTPQHTVIQMGQPGAVVFNHPQFSAEQTTATCQYGQHSLPVTIPLPGEAMLHNVQAACTLAWQLGIPGETVQTALATLQPVARRMTVSQGANQSTLIDDTYNANPHAMQQSLAVLKRYPGPHVCVLGDMLELGEASADYHQALAEYVQTLKPLTVVTVGKASEVIARHCGGQAFADTDACLSALPGLIPKGATVLIKGSNGMKMQPLIAELQCGAVHA